MADTTPSPSSAASAQPSPAVDGIMPAPSQPTATPAASTPAQPAGRDPALQKEVNRTKRLLLFFLVVLYAVYGLWSATLMSILPSPTGELQQLVQVGFLVAVVGGVAFLLIGFLLLQRIARADVPIATRQKSFIKVFVTVIPGIAISVAVPFVIMRGPTLGIDITPSDPLELVAPVAVTLDVKRAADTLKRLGQLPVQYVWDTDGDGKPNETTTKSDVTIIFQRAGTYDVTARIDLNSGTAKRVRGRIIIQQDVFYTTPVEPIVEKPVRFSVVNLLKDPKLLRDVQWDFDGDGTVDETVKTAETMHTFYVVGKTKVKATVDLTDNTQRAYERVITIKEPPPLPFTLALKTDPKMLIGPVPFGVLFSLNTKEPLKEVQWNFGDGKEERGADLTRIGHTFDTAGIYNVITKVRSANGKIAELSTLVRVTQKLNIPDLTFEGQPEMKGGEISGDVPLTVQLTPKTTMPLIQFSWDVPDDTNMKVSNSTFQAVYRREGSYLVTLIAQDPDLNTLRMPIKISVKPPATQAVIDARPEGGAAPLHVVFDAADTFIPPGMTIAGFKWKFGDEQGNAREELGGSRVEHTYKNPGEFHVELAVVMTTGEEFKADRTVVVRKPALSACITASRTSVGVGKGVQFDSSCSTGSPVSYLWEVRDALNPSISLAQGPNPTYVHVFDQPGEYSVTLTIKDNSTYTDSKNIIITVTP